MNSSERVRQCLQSHNESRLQQILTELQSTIRNNYWNEEIGKGRYQIAYLPVGMDPIETTFGKKTGENGNMKEVIFPNKTENELMFESLARCRFYKISHNNYEPAEKISRSYKLPFNKDNCYGKNNKTDHSGKCTKKALNWINNNEQTVVDIRQANFKQQKLLQNITFS